MPNLDAVAVAGLLRAGGENVPLPQLLEDPELLAVTNNVTTKLDERFFRRRPHLFSCSPISSGTDGILYLSLPATNNSFNPLEQACVTTLQRCKGFKSVLGSLICSKSLQQLASGCTTADIRISKAFFKARPDMFEVIQRGSTVEVLLAQKYRQKPVSAASSMTSDRDSDGEYVTEEQPAQDLPVPTHGGQAAVSVKRDETETGASRGTPLGDDEMASAWQEELAGADELHDNNNGDDTRDDDDHTNSNNIRAANVTPQDMSESCQLQSRVTSSTDHHQYPSCQQPQATPAESSVHQPHAIAVESSVHQPHATASESPVDQPQATAAELSVDQLQATAGESSVDQPQATAAESPVDQPQVTAAESPVDQPQGTAGESPVHQPQATAGESSVDQPQARASASTVHGQQQTTAARLATPPYAAAARPDGGHTAPPPPLHVNSAGGHRQAGQFAASSHCSSKWQTPAVLTSVTATQDTSSLGLRLSELWPLPGEASNQLPLDLPRPTGEQKSVTSVLIPIAEGRSIRSFRISTAECKNTRPSVHQPQATAAESSVHQPQATAGESSVDQPKATAAASSVHQPQATPAESPVDQPQATAAESPVDQPQTTATESSVDQPQATVAASSVHQPQATAAESPVHQPQAAAGELSVHQPQATAAASTLHWQQQTTAAGLSAQQQEQQRQHYPSASPPGVLQNLKHFSEEHGVASRGRGAPDHTKPRPRPPHVLGKQPPPGLGQPPPPGRSTKPSKGLGKHSPPPGLGTRPPPGLGKQPSVPLLAKSPYAAAAAAAAARPDGGHTVPPPPLQVNSSGGHRQAGQFAASSHCSSKWQTPAVLTSVPATQDTSSLGLKQSEPWPLPREASNQLPLDLPRPTGEQNGLTSVLIPIAEGRSIRSVRIPTAECENTKPVQAPTGKRGPGPVAPVALNDEQLDQAGILLLNRAPSLALALHRKRFVGGLTGLVADSLQVARLHSELVELQLRETNTCLCVEVEVEEHSDTSPGEEYTVRVMIKDRCYGQAHGSLRLARLEAMIDAAARLALKH